MGNLPLEGYRVIDFGWAAAAPRATCLLADMGAEVIKVETHRRLDPVRFGPDNTERDPEKDPLFHSINRNKLGILLDLKKPEGNELIKDLIGISDVVVENFSPGVMKRFSLDYDELKKVKSDIIMISFPGVGSEGPLSDVVTYGPSLAALAGLDNLIGYEGERVLGMQQAYADINSSLFGAFAVQIALFHREKYGKGQRIEVAQMETLLSTMPEPILEFSFNKRILSTLGNVSNIMPVHNNFPCKGEDKWVSIALLTDEEWDGFCRAIGNPSWIQKEVFADNYKRSLNRIELDKLIGEWTREKTPYEVMEILQKEGVAAAPCADTEDRFSDPHFSERQNIVNIEHPVTGVDFVPNVVCNLSETPGEIRRPAPMLGEHNEYVFGELLGLSKEKIDRYVKEKILY
ncbi:MAG: CoA transferase [Deltaproteobacteria bacterium]|nr:CoA transferase [Deltaproteobacteria bacterium]